MDERQDGDGDDDDDDGDGDGDDDDDGDTVPVVCSFPFDLFYAYTPLFHYFI
jgi:hypothetical protein